MLSFTDYAYPSDPVPAGNIRIAVHCLESGYVATVMPLEEFHRSHAVIGRILGGGSPDTLRTEACRTLLQVFGPEGDKHPMKHDLVLRLGTLLTWLSMLDEELDASNIAWGIVAFRLSPADHDFTLHLYEKTMPLQFGISLPVLLS
jgi:hypothetical protein